MDLSKITDINALKAMAYDAIAQKEVAEKNLNLINQRILQLSRGPSDGERPTRDAEGKEGKEGKEGEESTEA